MPSSDPNSSKRTAAISFTGGKDSCLAFHLSQPTFHITHLVMFCPANMNKFLAHPRAIVQLQANTLNLPLKVMTIEGPDFLECYRKRLQELRDTGIEVLITGDILDVCSNFMPRAASGILELHRPLWDMPRDRILDLLRLHSFSVMITCASISKLGVEDALWLVGERLDSPRVQSLLEGKPGVDRAGEMGEFHTMVLDAPAFQHRLEIDGEKRVEGDFVFFDFDEAMLVKK
ncbi:uncharacterized protein VTP21DRAFT_960 [Calcarisporiella thermophila]|uniref:uncharacterized protein n=1 Tax=Calcarisporiella thermophila TaxID=911321 RepID=UPI0037424110